MDVIIRQRYLFFSSRGVASVIFGHTFYLIMNYSRFIQQNQNESADNTEFHLIYDRHIHFILCLQRYRLNNQSFCKALCIVRSRSHLFRIQHVFIAEVKQSAISIDVHS